MKIIYTIHALYRMSIREITKEMVEKVLSEPEKTGTGYRNRLLVWKSFEKGKIKVVYTIENTNYVVISVMWE